MTDQLKMSDLGAHAYLTSWQEDRREKNGHNKHKRDNGDKRDGGDDSIKDAQKTKLRGKVKMM